jgi:alkylation response protein AidB-like acyl-CoA dehydrogenase
VRFALNEDEVGFRDAVRSLLADTCPPDAVRAAWGGEVGRHTGVGDAEPRRQGRVPAAWAGLAEMGVLGMVVPDALGGLGLDDEAVVPVLVECGRAALPDPVSSTAYVAASLLRDSLVLGEHAAAVGRAHLPGIVAGTTTAVVGFPGSALLPAARSADLFLMCLDDEVHLLVPDEVQLTPVESVDGARGLCRVQWDPTPGTAVLTGPDAVHAVNRAFDRAALGAAAMLVGLAERMVELTVGYVAERRQFGVPVGSFQAVKHRLADTSLAVEFAGPLVWRAANSLAHAEAAAPVHVSMAKARASEAARGAATACLQCHGAIGYTVEYDLHLYMKRAWALAGRYGDADFHRRRIRLALLGAGTATP